MSTVPTHDDAAPDPWQLVDGCPNCVTNVEPPFTWDVTETETRCSYICRDCRHIWSTSWGV